jgi:hypothetical protein
MSKEFHSFPQQDSPDPDLPEMVEILAELQETDRSIYWRRSWNELTVIPSPNKKLLHEIEDYFEEFRVLLPGVCDGCGMWVVRRFESYWGAHPHFCKRCVSQAVQIFNKTDKWPDAEIPAGLPEGL